MAPANAGENAVLDWVDPELRPAPVGLEVLPESVIVNTGITIVCPSESVDVDIETVTPCTRLKAAKSIEVVSRLIVLRPLGKLSVTGSVTGIVVVPDGPTDTMLLVVLSEERVADEVADPEGAPGDDVVVGLSTVSVSESSYAM